MGLKFLKWRIDSSGPRAFEQCTSSACSASRGRRVGLPMGVGFQHFWVYFSIVECFKFWEWICAWWSTVGICCVYVLDMGVCASSGSVGFWPIIPAALRSQLRSHAHIWHSFPDMITIHLPLRVWLRAVFPSFPCGTAATSQKCTTHPPAPPYSIFFNPHPHLDPLPPHCPLHTPGPPPPPPARIPAALQWESSGTAPFPP